jgi:excisionase family DNA binding protein
MPPAAQRDRLGGLIHEDAQAAYIRQAIWHPQCRRQGAVAVGRRADRRHPRGRGPAPVLAGRGATDMRRCASTASAEAALAVWRHGSGMSQTELPQPGWWDEECGAAAGRVPLDCAAVARCEGGELGCALKRPSPLCRGRVRRRRDAADTLLVRAAKERRVEELLTVEEVATRLGTRVRFVRRLIAERRISYIKVGRYVRISRSDLEAFIQTGRVETGSGR